ncbi:hypothetical protein HPP92_026727 [Vanilla planifolia]|uniref:Uncharacterized protein n=1 Tax=Vanilla planifolia TaxID=51239 RepID=A0A835U984_VANPL|nr:hypothetical protein HPP92_026727 [Vanilla planifolia]
MDGVYKGVHLAVLCCGDIGERRSGQKGSLRLTMGFGKLDGAAHWWSGNDDFRYEFLTGGAPIEAAIRQRIVGTLNLGFLVAIVLGGE